MNQKDTIHVVTVTYNAEGFIDLFLSSLLKQHINATLVVVDNNSSDNTIEKLESYRSQFTTWELVILPQVDNVGVAEGNNIGIRWSLANGADEILLVNNDVEFEDGALGLLLDRMNQTGNVIVPTIFYGTNKNAVWYGGGEIIKWKGHTVHRETELLPSVKSVTYAPTCCMAIPSSVFGTVGLMDPSYFVYFDDTDFCARLNKWGITIEVLKDSKVYHYVSSSTGQNSPFTMYFGERNRLYFIAKNLHGFYKFSSILYYATSRLYRLFVYLVKNQGWKRKSLFLAIRDFSAGRMGTGSFFSTR